jgi:hypothetical protein
VKEIATFSGPGVESASLHADIHAAKDTISKIRILEDEYGVHTALAHDAMWLREGKDRVLMSLLDDKLQAAAKDRIPYDEIP